METTGIATGYGYRKKLGMPYQAAVDRLREELQKQGFGILTEIDVKATLKKKLGVEFENYIILGACNPPFAYQAIQSEQEIGLMMPCNVIVYEKQGMVYVSAVLPTAAMGMIENPKLKRIAQKAEIKLKAVVDGI